MTAPFDPDETHGNESEHEHESEPREELLDANSMTWGTVDPDFDEMFRERLGPLPIMPTPPYAFERVLVTGRRRRARKVWAGTAAAALVVLAGTAGTTVALHTTSSGSTIGPAGTTTTSAASAKATPSPSVSRPAVVPPTSKSASPTPSAATTTTPAGAASTAPSTPQCLSSDFTLTVTAQTAASDGSGGSADQLLIVLTNTSGHSCTTHGYPGLELETQGSQLQTTTVTRIDKSDVQMLTVAANEAISTTATYTALASGASAGPDCGAPSYYLAVIPPNQQTQIVQPITGSPITVCGGGELDTTPLVPGSTG
jgi:hypothetical protein